MKATVWKSPNTVQVEDARSEDPQRADAIVKITSTAICGSDLHLLQAYVPAMMPGDILGHEFMGEVVEVGPQVNNLKVGDRVVVPSRSPAASAPPARKGCTRFARTPTPTRGWPRSCGATRERVSSAIRISPGGTPGQAEYAWVPFADVGPPRCRTA